MSNQDWSHIGDDIMDAVQTAIEEGDFTNLSNVLNDSANLAMDKFQDALNGTSTHHYSSYDRNRSRSGPRSNYRYSSQGRYQGTSQTINRQSQTNTTSEGTFTSYKMPQKQSRGAYGGADHYNSYQTKTSTTARSSFTGALAPFQKFRDRFLPPGRLAVPAYIQTAIGAVIGGGCLISEISILAALIFLPFEAGAGIAFGILLPFTIGGIAAFAGGLKKLKLLKKFKKYVSYIDDKEYYPTKELAAMAGVSKQKLVEDLKKMIEKGWFKQGHLDANNDNLILTNAAYRQYRETQNRYERQILNQKSQAVGRRFDGVGADGVNLSEQAANAYKTANPVPVTAPGNASATASANATANAAATATVNPLAHLPEEAQIVIREGRDYLFQIKKSNEAIPGEEISVKISRLETIIDQIFDRVEQHPDLIDDLRRFMKYYLPTTVKLLKAYEDLDSQAAQGPNIQKSKADIEETLDTINQAFENLLDSFFATSAVDIASDISVMQSLMAQEGLLEDEIKKQQQEAMLSEAETMISYEEEEEEEEDLLFNRPDPIQEFLQTK